MKLTKEQQNQVNKIGRKYDLKFILIYGSFATNNARPGSDFDVAVLGNKEIGFKTLLAIHGELSGVFGDNKDRELDLKSLHGAGTLFLRHVTRDGILIYGNQTDFYNFQAYGYKRY
ncbi:MAG: nucleotidyltransferase domain-containing protein, partial [bacterium]